MNMNFTKYIYPEVKSWERLFFKHLWLKKRTTTTTTMCYRNCFNSNYLIMYIIYGLVLLNFCKLSVASIIMGDSCDWSGSGLDSELEDGRAGVTPIYLRCTGGEVNWIYPRGALRILLRLPAGDNREFKACIKVRGDKDIARIFLEGQRSLHSLQIEPGSNHIRCFQSRNSQAALYVESTDMRGLKKHVVELEYDLQPLPEGVTHYDPFEDCRPCSNEEMVHAFCTSDLVTRGIIKQVEHSDDLEQSQLNVRVTKLIRHIPNGLDGDDKDDGMKPVHKEIVTHTSGRTARSVNIYVASHCGVSHGSGEFVFMARRRLGDLTMKCAPRLEDWMDTIRLMRDQGKELCILNS